MNVLYETYNRFLQYLLFIFVYFIICKLCATGSRISEVYNECVYEYVRNFFH